MLQVIDSLGMGGAETWLLEACQYWRDQRIGRMDFLVTSGRRALLDDEMAALGAQLHYAAFGRAHLLSFGKSFRRILREGRYGAIHDHQGYAAGWHLLLGRGCLPPIRVAHVHNAAYQIRGNYGTTPLRRLTASAGKRLLAHYATHVGGTSAQVLREYGFDAPAFAHLRRGALHCGFDTRRYLGEPHACKDSVCREFGWPQGSRIILVAGRIDESPDLGHAHNDKNSALAARIGIECARRSAAVHVLFAGARSAAVPRLAAMAAEQGLDGRIVFAGVRRDMPRLMLASDALLFPSRGEGLGMVAVEAQAAGLPVLASSAVPAECVVVPSLVRFESLSSSVDRWAVGLLELLWMPRDAAAANARVAASAFAIQRSAQALATLYRAGTLP